MNPTIARVILICAAVCSTSPVTIPLGYDENGLLYINITLPDLVGDITIPISLKSFARGASIYFGEEREISTAPVVIPVTLGFPQANRSILYTHPYVSIRTARSSVRADQVSSAALGIHGLGDFVENFASVDLYRNSGLLVLSQFDETDFLNNCESRSFISIPFSHEMAIPLSITTGDVISIRIQAFSFVRSDPGIILELPSSHMRETLRVIGLDASTRTARFPNCVAIRDRLPQITLTLHTPSSGQLVLYPEDYTRLYVDGSCSLLVKVNRSNSELVAHFDPLLLPEVNIRITPQSLQICDDRNNQ